jgi:solute carrier family 30 (zinc transporter), member 1
MRRSTSVSLHRHNTSTSSYAHVRGDVVEEEEEEEIGTPTATRHRHSSVASHREPHAQHTSDLAIVEEGKGTGHHHHHGSMNMRALLLHVLGDALGNVGVISSGLIIWQTTWKWKYYSDPIISLLITVIIFSSALPLVKSASFILLQGRSHVLNIDIRY